MAHQSIGKLPNKQQQQQLVISSDLTPTYPATQIDKNNNQQQHDVIEVQTTADASRLISSGAFQSKLKSLPRLTVVKVRINEPLNVLHAEKPKRLEFQGKRRILISLESAVNESQKIIYWRSKSSGEFSQLKLIHGYTAAVTAYARDFLVESLEEKPDSREYFLSQFSVINCIIE
jgi:hypothetical protein